MDQHASVLEHFKKVWPMSKEKIESYEVKTRLSEILRRVRAGESFTITLRGKPVADLLPSRAASRQKTAAAIENILRIRETVVPISDDRLEEYRKEGRK
jgi:prevent-host-death family protein